jgi:aryl carrier-like protein
MAYAYKKVTSMAYEYKKVRGLISFASLLQVPSVQCWTTW